MANAKEIKLLSAATFCNSMSMTATTMTQLEDKDQPEHDRLIEELFRRINTDALRTMAERQSELNDYIVQLLNIIRQTGLFNFRSFNNISKKTVSEALKQRDIEIKEFNSRSDRGRGYFESVQLEGNNLKFRGFVFSPERQYDTIQVFVNKQFFGASRPLKRNDLLKAFPFIPHSQFSGFNISAPGFDVSPDEVLEIAVVCMSYNVRIGKIVTWYSRKLSESIVTPPSNLMKRVTNDDYLPFYKATALNTLRDYCLAVSDFADLSRFRKVLDWGSGCGRLSCLLKEQLSAAEIHGCDVDAEAVEWCLQNIKGVEFRTVPFLPPTDYPDNSFDLIIANSVLTHLSKSDQLQWLNEMSRILVPGGFLVASVHGEYASYYSFPESSVNEVLAEGIYDRIQDNNLEGIAPDGYYRATFQTREYTETEYSKLFQVLAYLSQGSLNFQDIAVLRK